MTIDKTLNLMHGSVALPAFFPDGTYGAVKTLDGFDLNACGVDGVVINALHLHSKPGLAVVKKHGGIHRFAGLNIPVLTDSGGFQVLSLLRENPKLGQIRQNEIIYRPAGEKLTFTPQKCIQLQFAVTSDIIMCLDWCTHPDDAPDVQQKSVDTTIRWAEACKKEYQLQLKNYKYTANRRPLLFAIIQGGGDFELRKKCAAALVDIGFDGYGYGGFPVDKNGVLVTDVLRYTAQLMPNGVKYAMGVGRPEEVVQCVKMGYNLFDCVIPTREARHKRLYVYNTADDGVIDVDAPNFYSYMYIADDKYAADTSPVSQMCGCHCCRNYSRAYLRHLFRVNDPLAARLATMHNLYFYTTLMRLLRENV